jgi:hypothetical protein
MPEECCSVPEAGCAVCELPAAIERPPRSKAPCPQCGNAGKPVEGQTVRALVSVSLLQVPQTDFLFCRTASCPVVFFASSGSPVFVTSQVREPVYQKEPPSNDVLICYCFHHQAGAIRASSDEQRATILESINGGVQAKLCACDLRNPQGSCCLGNVQALIKEAVRV